MWDDYRVISSSNKNVKKYVFENKTAVAESVLYKYPTYKERTVICCSTQSGCPVGCRFCGAGDNFVRSLTVDEIVLQPMQLLDDACNEENILPKEIDRLQIMFMSMGEPLLNLNALSPALYRLHSLYYKAALLISTIGPAIDYQPLWDACKDLKRVGLQFSVHESTDERRNKLIPFAKKLTLEQIAMKGEMFYILTGRFPFFNFCAHEGNSSGDDADRLVKLFDPKIWQATISVICERDEHVAAANARQRELAESFRDKLRVRGYSTRVFDPAGQDDCGGGCGQLWYVQDWMKSHSNLARPSIGYSLPMVHTPRETCSSERSQS